MGVTAATGATERVWRRGALGILCVNQEGETPKKIDFLTEDIWGKLIFLAWGYRPPAKGMVMSKEAIEIMANGQN